MVADALHAAFEYVPSKQVITCRNCSPADLSMSGTANISAWIAWTITPGP